MFNVGGGELLVIMLIALIVLGPQRLPDAAKQVGRVMGDLRRISSGFQQELKDAFDTDDAPTPLRRKESVPLASTVAKADREAEPAPRRDAHADADPEAAPAVDHATAHGVGATGDDDAAGTTVAPAVAAALDEIVTPLDAHAAPPAPAEPAGPPVAEAADSAPSPADGGDALGDERAAS